LLRLAVGVSCAAQVSAQPFAYVLNQADDTVSVIDTATNTVTATIPVGSGPLGVAVHPTGSTVYVTNQGGGTNTDTLAVIDSATNTVTTYVPVGSRPFGVAVHPDGSAVYVTNAFDDDVSVVDTSTNMVTATVAVGSQPIGVAVHPAGTFVYVANFLGHSISVIDAATLSVTDTVTIGAPSGPWAVAVHPAGTFAYVTDINISRVLVIDTVSNALATTVTVGVQPNGVAVHPAGTFAYVSNLLSDSLSVIATASHTVLLSVPVDGPNGVGVHPSGSTVYVPDGNDQVTLIDSATNTVTSAIPVGDAPIGFGQFILTSAPRCSSNVTTIAQLQTEIDALNTSKSTKKALTSTLDNVLRALDHGQHETARSRLENLLGTVVNRSNLKVGNPNRIALNEANSVICGASNVLIGIHVP
jgi:YVTN family beta-propeller protein